MKRIIIALAVALCIAAPVFARDISVTTGFAEAEACGLVAEVGDNYSLFGGLDGLDAEYGFRMYSSPTTAHPKAWVAEGAMMVYGIIYVKLPEGLSSYDVVVTKESGMTFTAVTSYSLNNSVLMLVPQSESDVFTIIRPGSQWAALKIMHVHEHEHEHERED